MKKRRNVNRTLLEFDKRDHIPLGEHNTETAKKKSRRFIPKRIEKEKIPEHSMLLSSELEKSTTISRSRRKIFQTKNVYFKATLMNEISRHEEYLEKAGIDLLVVLDSNKAIVRLTDDRTEELLDKIRNYEEQEFLTVLSILNSFEPISTTEKIEPAIEDEIKSVGGDKPIFVEIRLFPNLDKDEYVGALRSIKEYIRTRGEEFVSEVLEQKRAKVRAKIRLSSIRELAEGVEPISVIDKIPRYRIEFLASGVDKGITGVLPQIQEDAPVVCVVDSGVAKDHPLLQEVIEEIVDFTPHSGDGYDNDGRGTFVTGLVVYGDLFHGEIPPPDTSVVVAKVMNKDGEMVDLEEILPKVVERFYRKTKVFNMSISKENCCRSLDTEFASKIDELERKYNVVFCIPTGNVTLGKIQAFINGGEEYPSYFDKAECLLLQPGEACNAITVGSIARTDSSNSLARKNEPSPFTRRGPTPENRTKPDFAELGGNLVSIQRSSGVYVDEDEKLMTVSLNSDLRKGYFARDNGTSYTAPLLSRCCAKIFKKFPRATPNLIKALLVNSIAYQQLTRHGSDKRLYGQGTPVMENALNSAPFRVTYYLESSVNMKDEKIIKFRVPERMSRIQNKKRMYIVLVYDPPVDSSKEYYVMSALDFKLHKGGTSERSFQSFPTNWVYDNRKDKWDNVKIAIYEWKRGGWGQDWSIYIIPYFPRALEYGSFDQRFALVITLEDVTKKVDIHSAVMNELGITAREIERIRAR